MPQIKVNNVVIEHNDSFTGEVTFTRGPNKFSVPIDALVTVVGEKVRAERIAILEKAKPSDLVRRLA